MNKKEELIRNCLTKAEEGMNIYDIRKGLQYKNVPEEDIKDIIRVVANYLLSKALTTSHKTKANELFWVGIILTIVGIIVTFGTLLGIINTGDSFTLAIGPILGGLSMIAISKAGYRHQRIKRNH
jgi:hypothetical protein